MKLGSIKVLSSLPQQACVEAYDSQGAFVSLPRELLAAGVAGIKLDQMTHLLALERYGMWWSRPVFGASESQVPADTQYLLWRRKDGLYGLLLPLVDGDLRAFLTGGPEGLSLQVHGAVGGSYPHEALTLLVAIGRDPYELSRQAVHAASRRLGTFRTREQKRMPAFVDYFGWCTWDAFYGAVDEAKVIEGLESFRKGGISPRFMILDDGWLDVEGHMLNSFRAAPAKFPNGLGGLIRQAKQNYGVECFGVWHTLQGYWNGINPAGEIPREFHVIENKASSPKGEEASLRHFVHLDDVHRFYQLWYEQLRREGVDMTKVDSQSSLMAFTNGVFGQNTAMKAYQQALGGAAHAHFEGNTLHCMCNGSDVAYNMQSTQVWRNSDDFYPSKPESHGRHVHMNAMNNLWTSTFSLPDWDMFQSGHAAGPFHAAARAISGGPIYVSDKPGQHDYALLKKLFTSDGMALRCPQPAQPAADCLFVDCQTQKHLLKVTNRCGDIGVLVAFNCRYVPEDNAPVVGSFSPADVSGLKGAKFAVYLQSSGELKVMRRRQKQPLALGPLGWELATISPIVDGLAAIGLVEKLNSAAAIQWQHRREDGALEMMLRDGGRIGLYAQRKPKSVMANGRAAKFAYDKASGLVTLKAAAGKPVRVVVRP